MERVNAIIQNQTYQTYLARIQEWEKARVYCKHDTAHFLDVARIARLLSHTQAYAVSKEIIYAAALLHDIGRWKQYESGEDHALVSSQLAPAILRECGFSVHETQTICDAIRTHRCREVMEQSDLNGLLYRADKLSRPCYFCAQESSCSWKEDKKNLKLNW